MNKHRLIPLTLLVMALWGSLFPCIKLGYRVWRIPTDSVGAILLFAGVRFLLCGIAVTAASLCRGKRVGAPRGRSLVWILLTGLLATVLHYACTYLGLSQIESAKTAILKQSGALFYICFSFLLVKEEHFSWRRIAAGLLGFFGVAATNFGGGRLVFSLGSWLIIAASFCTVFSNLACKRAMATTDPFLVTGLSQLFGGAVLTVIGFAAGARLPTATPAGLGILGYICAASTAGYCLWYWLVNRAALSGLFILKFAEPLFAVLFSWILLGETVFKPPYAVALVLVGLSVWLAERATVRE